MGTLLGHEVEFAAVEQDSSAEVFKRTKATGVVLDGLNAAIKTFTHGVGNSMPEVG